MVDIKGVKGASESLPREGGGTSLGPGRSLFLEVAWDQPAALFGPVGTYSLPRIFTFNRKCPSHSHYFLGILKALLVSCLASPQGGLALRPWQFMALLRKGWSSMLYLLFHLSRKNP